MAADVLAREQKRPVGVEQAGRVQAAGAVEAGLLEALGKGREHGPGDDRAVRQIGRVHGNLLERALTAHPT